MSVHIRWIIRTDMPEVLDIERHTFEFPWSEDEFVRVLRELNCIGIVAEENDRVIGYMIYEIHKTRFHVLNFAVAPLHRRMGIGRAMLTKLIGRLSPDRRKRIVLECRESNTAAQLFFRSQGFKAVSILRGFYDDTVEDAYVFQYRLESVVDGLRCGEQSAIKGE
jgi:ribosomal-protein-alanine N-acetyltransferase